MKPELAEAAGAARAESFAHISCIGPQVINNCKEDKIFLNFSLKTFKEVGEKRGRHQAWAVLAEFF